MSRPVIVLEDPRGNLHTILVDDLTAWSMVTTPEGLITFVLMRHTQQSIAIAGNHHKTLMSAFERVNRDKHAS